MYIFMNCLNSYLVDSITKAGARARTNPESRFKELRIVEPNIFRALLPYAIAQLKVEILSSSLRIIKPRERLFKQIIIFFEVE